MAVVRGDRIAESARLNVRSVEAQEFYALFVSRIPDAFGRFRLNLAQIIGEMYPRRELTGRLLSRVRRLMGELGGGENPLWLTWECDGVTFGEMWNWRPTGNCYHRTPEPPWSAHEHNGACFPTAIYRAKAWRDGAEVEKLSNAFKDLRERRHPESTQETPREPLGEGGHSVRSVPSVRSVKENGERTTEAPPSAPPTDRLFEPPPEKPKTATAPRKAGKKPALSRADAGWNAEAADMFLKRYKGTKVSKQMFSGLRDILDAGIHWERVKPAFQNYIDETAGSFFSISRFAETFGTWEGPRNGRIRDGPGRQNSEDATAQALRNVLRKAAAAQQGGGDDRVRGVLDGFVSDRDATQPATGRAEDGRLPHGPGGRDG